MIYGYARVSTKNQNLQLQIDSLEKYGCDKIYSDRMSGDYRKKPTREQLDKLLSEIKKGDTLVVWKLDRLSRTLIQIVNILEHLLNNEINFVSISDNFDTTTSYGKALLYIAAIFAQLEVDLIKERTIAGLEAARLQGRIGGRRSISKVTQSTMYQMYYSGDYTISEICNECNISPTTLYKYLHMYNEEPDTIPELLDFKKVQIVDKANPKAAYRNCGRHQTDKATIKLMQELYNSGKYKINDILKETGVSRSTFYKYYKQKE